ncbi:aldehyde dehydrogenase [Actinomadura parmotrematis]|uniref:Aldehyde dehydrogenase n=1 Tax=Actinomadura parmotrematis TaxID=2864039 RepID=A0ABS7G067_9ACTN|nr:aldehyde dehydrogenase [Actinomadura parmotrematis]MBW8486078.1 aldehyde dehydrogenase [Actinomadura parmotrematis]
MLDSPSPLLIDGRLAAGSGGTFATLNPATGEVLGEAADATAADMDAAIAAARRAFDESPWPTDLALRVRCLRQLRDALQRHADELRELTIAEVGAPRFLTYGAQLDAPVNDIGWFADLAESYAWTTDLGRAEPMGMASDRTVVREPVGVVGAITPWNFPHQINLAKLGPALAAGNTVVLKPAPDTPWCAAVLGAVIARETDIPAGVVNIVTSSDHALGAQLAEDPRVDLVSFTGSTETGRKVMRAAVPGLKRVFLELGGKSAFIVLDDADLKAACSYAAFSSVAHAGQGCALTTRILVPRDRYDEAARIIGKTLARLGAGDPADDSTICGPVISERQRDRVEGYLELAVKEGGTFAAGGGRPEGRDRGFWIEPTLVTGLDAGARTAREEIFGPVLVLLPHDGDDDAVRIANDSPYGLSGAVHGGAERARAVAARLRAGTVSVNSGVWYGADVPFGGYKQSGIGREMGVAGFEEYLETKAIAEGI